MWGKPLDPGPWTLDSHGEQRTPGVGGRPRAPGNVESSPAQVNDQDSSRGAVIKASGDHDDAVYGDGRPLVIDRGVRRAVAASSKWRAVARNAWSAEGMVEFYVDDVLTLPFTMPGALTGRFATTGGSLLREAHRLNLPQATGA